MNGAWATYNARWLDPAVPSTAVATQSDEAKGLVEEVTPRGRSVKTSRRCVRPSRSGKRPRRSGATATTLPGSRERTTTGDKPTAKRLLEQVVAADPSLDAGNVAENKADQNKAKALLASFDSLFAL